MKRSPQISVHIKNLDFPDEFTISKGQCSLGDTSPKNVNPMRSIDFGLPEIMTIRKPFHKSSSYESSPITVSPFKSSSKIPSHLSTSRALVDTKHRKSVGTTALQFKKPCADSLVIDTPIAHIGKYPGRERNKFKLTEDPRKRIGLKNPDRVHSKPISQPLEIGKVKELIMSANNVISLSETQSSNSSICEVIDLVNPLGLDFQGTDYKNTYERDEQLCQNQIEYRKIRRFQQRRNIQLKTVGNTEKELQLKRIAIPNHFKIDSDTVQAKRYIRLSNELGEKKRLHGSLVRAEQKPEVYQRLREEEERRKERYKQLYFKKKLKMAEKLEEETKYKKAVADTKATVLVEKDIEDFVNLLDRKIITKKMDPQQIPERKRYPHNISETIRFRCDMKKSKRILRDRARVKQNFYEKLGIPKKIPEANLEISDSFCSAGSHAGSEEQSTNDEDDMIVGQKGNKFLLRGFRYKLGTNLRGKFNQHELSAGDGKTKGCITRTEWFESLVPRNTKRNETNVKDMKLFSRDVGLIPLRPKSAIKEFRKRPLGRHYDRTIRKKLHIKKPKTLKVRKFNLIGYLYGNAIRKSFVEDSPQNVVNMTTLEYMSHKTKEAKLKQALQKKQRMRYLGITYSQKQRRKAKLMCADSDSTDSNWIPSEISQDKIASEHVDLNMRGNMPAPKKRETTIRQHPKYSRDYKKLRVPSAILDEFVKHQHIPVMIKLKDDKNVVENVRTVKKTEYATKFDARHHHDHWNPTQHKAVNVLYSRKIVKPKLLEEKSDEGSTDGNLPKIIHKVRPRESDVSKIDFSIPKLNINEIIENHRRKSKSDLRRRSKVDEFHQSKDMFIHSLADGELQQFPGRDNFLEFIAEIKAELNKRAGLTDAVSVIDKIAFINELKEDLSSIESCVTSLSSSECTNLSNDSGSFLMAGDKKIPLDYLRKSVVPFEEINRHRIEAIPIDATKEQMNPYQIVPFAGQEKEQLLMMAAKENFFTFNTRLRNGMRQRLEVKPEDPKYNIIGPRGGPKAIAQVATDIDELYIEDIQKPPPLKPFKWNSCRSMIKDALRKKFETMLIQGEIVRAKISDRRNEEYFQQMMKTKELFEKLFSTWEKMEYEAAMDVVNKVKPYYEATDVYRKESLELGKQYTRLNMDIVYIENDWTRRTIFQNFHYLLAEMEWRVEHDWIHRKIDGSLEGFEESISKRSIVNIRPRDKDDAWAIKEYYEEVFLKNPHPVIVVFAHAKDFTNGIENLKSKTFIQLLELHYTFWILFELEQKYQEFSEWCAVELESKKKYAESRCANKYFMENRAEKLKEKMEEFIGDPIDEFFNDKQLAQIKGICNEVYKDVVPISDQMDLTTLEQVAAISDLLTELMGKFENISVAQRIRVEKKHRRMLDYHRNLSKQAVFIERRIASEMIKVHRNMEPPFQKPKREGKLPRSELKKVVRVIHEKPTPISNQTRLFYKAFHDEGDPEDLKEVRDSSTVDDAIQQSIVPFYFDHFLTINGYQPQYDFKTQVELRDGAEIDRMHVKKILPDVVAKLQKWEVMKKRIMEENINKNPKMYENVRV